MSDENQTEAELALKKRRGEQEVTPEVGLDDTDLELLDQNKIERDLILSEITELRERSDQRKKEREAEEQRLAAERAAEDARRKAEEEERRRKKLEDEENRKSQRAQKMAEFEKWKIPQKANFVISKKSENSLGAEPDEEQEDKPRKSKEQLEAEKQAVLHQRIRPLEISDFDAQKMTEKAKELHHLINRLEGEKYDLEKRYKVMQVQLMELAERAREAKGVGKDGVKRIAGGEETVDHIQTRFAGAPSKVEMFSKYERMKDKRTYVEKHVVFTGPQYACPAERIKPTKCISWDEEGLPIYQIPDTPAQ